MTLSRIELADIGSPAALAARIHELAPNLPPNFSIEAISQQLDICSIEEIATGGFEAALVMDELKASGAILLAAGRSHARRRFSIGHELGHFLIPSHRPRAGHPFECSLADLHLLNPKDRDRRKQIEAEANRFAAHLLMPPERLRAAMRRVASNLETILALSREFGVSKEAMARAWVEAHREPVAIIIAHRHRVLRQYRSQDFPWLPGRPSQRLPASSVAAETFAMGSFSAVEEVDPETWLTERDAARTLLLTEQVLGQRDDYAMILLQAELDED